MLLSAFNVPFIGLVELCLALGFAVACACGSAAEPPTPSKESFPGNCTFAAIPAASRQILVAAGKSAKAEAVHVYLLSRTDKGWSVSAPPISAVIGRNGFAAPETKREGDGKTPSGVYPLELAFGYGEKGATKMPYRQATDQDVWVDDEGSPDYNRWVRRNETTASYFEELRRRDNLYKYGLVIGYNTRPAVKGLGSAIFVHLWKGPGKPTSGCLAMAEKDMLRVLGWLDPQQNPLIILGTEKTILNIAR